MQNEVIIGDCAEVLKTLPDESIDCIVTDPPYGYSFMGLQWDKALPSLEALKECCRVLKHGAFGFFMCAPRQDVLSRMIIRLEDAGFNVGFSSIYFCFASGFPKSANIGKLIDKRNGRTTEEYKALGDYLRTQREIKGLSQKDIAVYFPSKTGGLTGCVWNWENAANVPTLEQWEILKELLDLDSRFDKLIEREEAQREVLLKKRVQRKGESWNSKSGMLAVGEQNFDITAPATDKAHEFSGSYSGLQLKPALECIITVMRPLSEKTYVDQALQNGHGCTWLSDCRIPYESDSDNDRKGNKEPSETSTYGWAGTASIYKSGERNEDGRFPANLLCSDNCLDNGIITKRNPNEKRERDLTRSEFQTNITKLHTNIKSGVHHGDSGDFSRYFSLDAWFDKKLQELPPEQQKTFPFLITPKPSKSEKNKYIENKHPTVKPIKLMSYLITMGSREGDLILDPFAGSGTTLEAARLLNRRFIGIDKDPENEKYMRARGQLNEVALETLTNQPAYDEKRLIRS